MRSGGAKKKDGPTSRRILRFVACSRKKGPERAFEPQEMTCARALRGQREGARCGGAGLKNPGPKMEDQKERELPPAPGNHTRLWCVEGSWSGVSLVGVCLGWLGTSFPSRPPENSALDVAAQLLLLLARGPDRMGTRAARASSMQQQRDPPRPGATRKVRAGTCHWLVASWKKGGSLPVLSLPPAANRPLSGAGSLPDGGGPLSPIISTAARGPVPSRNEDAALLRDSRRTGPWAVAALEACLARGC